MFFQSSFIVNQQWVETVSNTIKNKMANNGINTIEKKDTNKIKNLACTEIE